MRVACGGALLSSAVCCLVLAALCLLLTISTPAQGLHGYAPQREKRQQETGKPQALQRVGFEQRLNEQVPLDLIFRDEEGRAVPLREYINGSKPVVLALVYFECPMLCNQVLNGMTGALKGMSLTVGKEFDVVAVSFDPRETSELARKKRNAYVVRYGRPGKTEGWHFLTGDEESIKKLTEAVGFRYYWDEQTKQFAHASGVMVVTPDGKLARYFYSIEYAPKDIRLGLVEAAQGKIGSPVDQLLLYCFHYDPEAGKYGPVVMSIVKISGALMLVMIAALYVWMWRRGASAKRREMSVGEVT